MKICIAMQTLIYNGQEWAKGKVIPDVDEATMARWEKNGAATILTKGAPKQPARLEKPKQEAKEPKPKEAK